MATPDIQHEEEVPYSDDELEQILDCWTGSGAELSEAPPDVS